MSCGMGYIFIYLSDDTCVYPFFLLVTQGRYFRELAFVELSTRERKDE